MKYEAQINELSSLSWKLKSKINTMEAMVKKSSITDTYRNFLEADIHTKKQEMITNAEAIDILVKAGK